MRRPLPHIPRGPRRKHRELPTVLLACPRVSPEWELNAIRALMKPQLGDAIRHRSGEQRWPRNAPAVVREVAQICSARLGFEPLLHLPDDGDFRLASSVPSRELEEAKAMAVLLSKRLPGVWFTVGRLMIHDGQFFRRRHGYKLEIVPATNVHIRRDIRAALTGVI